MKRSIVCLSSASHSCDARWALAQGRRGYRKSYLMFPSFWGFPSATDAMLQQAQRELDRMRERFDSAFRLALDPAASAGRTPAEVVYLDHRLRLLHYHPLVEQRRPVPLLLVPSLIGKHYLLDFAPGKSLVEALLREGLDVYLLDWGVPAREDRYITFDQYITVYLRRAVRRVCALSGQDQISLLGYSMGGTLAAIFSEMFGQHVRNLVQLSAPIDFHDGGLLAEWTRKERFNVDLVVDTLGAMPTELMRASFRLLKPTTQIAQAIAQAERFGDLDAMQDFLALFAWLDDDIPLLGEAYRKYIKDCYQENYLVQGKLVIDGRRVNLSQIECPLLTITAERDFICPPRSAAVLNDLVRSADKQLLNLPSGHISVLTGSQVASKMWPQLSSWLLERSGAAQPAQEPPTNAPEPAVPPKAQRRRKS
jgi:polyhydroxyalkanoate synthase